MEKAPGISADFQVWAWMDSKRVPRVFSSDNFMLTLGAFIELYLERIPYREVKRHYNFKGDDLLIQCARILDYALYDDLFNRDLNQVIQTYFNYRDGVTD